MKLFGIFSRATNIVSITLDQDKITCLWASKYGQKILIKAYEKSKLNNLEFLNSIVFNQTKICNLIKNFIKKNRISKPKISLAVSGKGIFEQIITISKTVPEQEDIIEIKAMAKKQFFSDQDLLQIDWTHLCHNCNQELNTAQIFYFCVMSNEKIFQYKLLAKNAKSNIVSITTENAAIIKLYKYCSKDNFSQTRFSIDLQENSFNLKKLIYSEKLKNLFDFKDGLKIDLNKEYESICIGAGLFLIGEKT